MPSLGVSGDTETIPGIIERLCNQVLSPAKIAAFHNQEKRGQTPLWGQGQGLKSHYDTDTNCPDTRTLLPDELAR